MQPRMRFLLSSLSPPAIPVISHTPLQQSLPLLPSFVASTIAANLPNHHRCPAAFFPCYRSPLPRPPHLLPLLSQPLPAAPSAAPSSPSSLAAQPPSSSPRYPHRDRRLLPFPPLPLSLPSHALLCHRDHHLPVAPSSFPPCHFHQPSFDSAQPTVAKRQCRRLPYRISSLLSPAATPLAAPSSAVVASSSAAASPASRCPLLHPLTPMLPVVQLCRRRPISHQKPTSSTTALAAAAATSSFPCLHYFPNRAIYDALVSCSPPVVTIATTTFRRTPLMPSSSSPNHVVVVADAASCSHAAVDRHCPFPSLSHCFPLRFHNIFCRCHHLPFQSSLAPTSAHFLCSHTKYDVTDVMAMDDALDARFKAFEARIKRLQELLREFKRSRSETYDHGQDTGYPRMREEFPRWEDRDPIG
ncbi:hypothetical protein GW17_00020690 [Ensete ventricosum]|nr:hypothetical protein GW17_00020690 [Ensete ventricosum]